jgi:ligand-binding sensor domain-containing protein
MRHPGKNFFGLILCIVAFAYQALCQQHVFNKVSSPDGKTFAHVTGICQDLNGYIWLATKEGLCRYDGYQITTYRHNPLDLHSLASDTLETVVVDSTGFVWVGTSAGLDRFDPSTGIFKHFRHDPENRRALFPIM